MQATPVIITGDGAYKECIGCGDFKPLLDFHSSKRAPSGRNYRCKSCQNNRLVSGVPIKQYREKRRAEEIVSRPRFVDDNQIIVTAAGNFRICKQCSEVRSTEDFYVADFLTDGIRKDCKNCVVARTAKYTAENTEKVKASAIEYRKTDRAKQLQKMRIGRWLQKHGRDAHVKKSVEWRKNNPEKALRNSRKYVLNRRARLAAAPGIFDYDLWLQKAQYHGWRCLYCSRLLTEKTVTVDHRKPLAKGGSN